ncbi:hypothetical protein [Flagellimonas sp.]|uniref:hypothetical protein n=1 Tax=Flagellimonas sp. TaxID=2058762 RepID=UPI003B506BA1
MIKQTVLTLFIVAFLCGSCSSSSESDPVVKEQVDTSPPSVTVSGIEESIELSIPISISISDDSNTVTTTILVNGTEVFSSTSKQFSFELDPFDYSNGSNSITIKSVDQNNNVSENTFNVNIQKLLYDHFSGFSGDSVDVYVAINLLETGELIAFRKINTSEDTRFYASDDFEKQDLAITEYFIGKNDNYHSAHSYANIAPGTIRLAGSERLAALGLEHNFVNKNDVFNLSVENSPSFFRFSLLGIFYSFGTSNDPVLTINYDKENTSDIFLIHHTSDNANLLTDYHYLYTEDFTDRTIDFDELSNLTPEKVKNVTLPESVESYTFSLFGYDSDKAYKEEYLRLLYGYGGETSTIGFSLNYPEINEYEILEKKLTFNLNDGRRVRLDRLDLSNVDIPEISIQQSGSDINIQGEYDLSELSLRVESSNGSDNTVFNRNYRSTYSSTISNPFGELEIPIEIVDLLNTQGLNLEQKDASGEMSLSLSQYENDINYPEGVEFYRPVANETGDVTAMIFPLNN